MKLGYFGPLPRIRLQDQVSKNSQYIGVYWDRFVGVWAAKVYDAKTGERIFLGFFDTELEAAQAYDETARKLFGKSARLNFMND